MGRVYAFPPLCFMNYNEVIEYEVTDDSGNEPVALDDLKRHLNMLFDTDASYVFDDDDTYLTFINKAARQAIEDYTGVSVKEKTITAIVRNELGSVEIPFGPVSTITSVKDDKGNVLVADDSYKVTGRQFKKLLTPTYSYLEVTYTTGYEAIPENLKLAIMHYAAYLYAQRGEKSDAESYSKSALELASPYKRTSWIA